MSLRIDVASLPEDVRRSLESGEAVEVERDGKVVAVIRSGERRPGRALWAALAAMEPLDDEFERDIASLDEVVQSKPFAWE